MYEKWRPVMNMQEIRIIAIERGVRNSNLKKAELIRAVQTAEGNEACFGVGKSAECGQQKCLWKADCN
jgi:hypothetical protein